MHPLLPIGMLERRERQSRFSFAYNAKNVLNYGTTNY
nr:MAG TPA: hypothetical protein [Caudoviricetes sp.]